VYVEVPYYQEGDPHGWKNGFWRDQVDPMVQCVGGVGVYQPEGMKVGPEKRFWGRDVEGEYLIHPLEPWVYRIAGEDRSMNVGHHAGLPNSGENDLKMLKEGR